MNSTENAAPRTRSPHWHNAAALGDTVTQGHADYCAEYGHNTWTDRDLEGNATERGICPRCGEVTIPATPEVSIYDEPEAPEAPAVDRGPFVIHHPEFGTYTDDAGLPAIYHRRESADRAALKMGPAYRVVSK